MLSQVPADSDANVNEIRRLCCSICLSTLNQNLENFSPVVANQTVEVPVTTHHWIDAILRSLLGAADS